MIPFEITDSLPDGPMLLEASAGTGKTWTIAGLAARHIAEAKGSRDGAAVAAIRSARRASSGGSG